jgi:colanic acid biosynthesis glycosyl transferase WcaI
VARILILTQYFTPEITAAPVRLHPFAAGLAARGHEVEVVCEIPNHPRGVVHAGYGRRATQRRSLDGFEVTYVWVRAGASKGAAARLASYASYAAMATGVAALRRRPELVLASSPPLSVAAVGALVAARHRVPWILDVRDLWPEVAVVLGEIRGRRLVQIAEAVERRVYASASAITTPTESFRDHIAARSPDPGKVWLLPNGTTREWLAAGEVEVDRATLDLPSDRFIWTYSGNVGLSQDLDIAIDAAGMLGNGFQLLIVGDGTSREGLEQRAASLPGGTVGFTGLVEPAEAARYMRASDALIVPLADRPELGKSIPIKLYDCCAIGRPLVLAAPGEPRRLAEHHEIALTVSPGDAAQLADAIRALRNDPALAGVLAARAREFAAEHLRERQLGRLDELQLPIANAQHGRWGPRMDLHDKGKPVVRRGRKAGDLARRDRSVTERRSDAAGAARAQGCGGRCGLCIDRGQCPRVRSRERFGGRELPE